MSDAANLGGAGESREQATQLGPQRRRQDLAAAPSANFDLVVIGGGVTGCGVALDAASRGMRVCLLERADFGSGTSSRSSKLVHGGLRYLEQLDFGLVREALHERRVLLEKVAPHLIRSAPFLLPLRHHYERAYIGAGVALYDVLAGRRPGVPRHRHLSKATCLRLAPGLNPDALVGGIRYHDAQVDDARLTLDLARTAAGLGAIVLNRVAVTDLLIEHGNVVGVRALDTDPPGGDAEPFTIRCAGVVNATGVWASEIERRAGVAQPLNVLAAKGIHVVVPRARVHSDVAMILRTEKSVLFLLPWGDHWIIGTTDTPWDESLDHPVATSEDIAYVLAQANAVLRDPLHADDVVAVFAGLRPLITEGSREAKATTRVSREHAVHRAMPGLVTIAGGKLTTYRLMAIDAVDAAVLGITAATGQVFPASRTADLALHGAGPAAGVSEPGADDRVLDPAVREHLTGRYGAGASEVLALLRADASLGGLLGRSRSETVTASPGGDRFDAAHAALPGGGRYLRAEVLHAVLHEGARSVEDVLARRTRLGIETAGAGAELSDEVARLLSGPLGWDEQRTAREAQAYRDACAATDAARGVDSDSAAVRAYLAVVTSHTDTHP